MAAHVIAVAGLGFGDEGKGSIVDALVRRHESGLVVRYNGGAQAAHNVTLPDGRTHCFAQFGAGTLAGAKTFLSQHVMVNPVTFLPEATALKALGVPVNGLVNVHADALVTTPFHQDINRFTELSREGLRHGSCGLGIGETRRLADLGEDYQLRVSDLCSPATTKRKLEFIYSKYRDEHSELLAENALKHPLWQNLTSFIDPEKTVGLFLKTLDIFNDLVRVVDGEWWLDQLVDTPTIVMEGAQGVLLDESYGFNPHTTWSTTTFRNATELVNYHDDATMECIGVLRAYATRHGHGPLPTKADIPIPGEHNKTSAWQGDFRTGHFDGVLATYARHVLGGTVDSLAVTCVDHVQAGPIKFAKAYEDVNLTAALLRPGFPQEVARSTSLGITVNNRLRDTEPIYEPDFTDVNAFLQAVADHLDRPVNIVSQGPTFKDKVFG